jgi:hypothetical protein
LCIAAFAVVLREEKREREEEEAEHAPNATSQAIVSTACRAYEKDSEESTVFWMTARE